MTNIDRERRKVNREGSRSRSCRHYFIPPPITKISTERSIFPLMESICLRGNIRDKNMLPLEWELGSLSIIDICAIIPREHKQKNFVCSNINVTGKLFGCFVHFHSFQFLRSPKSPRNFTISPLSRANL